MSTPDGLDFGQTIRGFAEGQTVFGRYVLKSILGRGGMGVVWLAEDEKLEELVALKFMPETVRLDSGAIDDLKRETRKSRKLTHANIVRVHGFEEDAATAAIAMEYVDGWTLSSLRLEQPAKVFVPEQLGVILQQLGEALTYAHEKEQVIHRDLKPANLMLNSRGQLKIADFGISSTLSDSASRMSVLRGSSGSPPYMSPQQMLGESPKVSDDIYSVGATIYELLTSKPPFYRGNIFAQARETVPPQMGERRRELLDTADAALPAISPLWEDAVALCLAKEPDERVPSIPELMVRLDLRPPSTSHRFRDQIQTEAPEFEPTGPTVPTVGSSTGPSSTVTKISRKGFVAGAIIVLGILVGTLIYLISPQQNVITKEESPPSAAAPSPSQAPTAVPTPTEPSETLPIPSQVDGVLQEADMPAFLRRKLMGKSASFSAGVRHEGAQYFAFDMPYESAIYKVSGDAAEVAAKNLGFYDALDLLGDKDLARKLAIISTERWIATDGLQSVQKRQEGRDIYFRLEAEVLKSQGVTLASGAKIVENFPD